MKASLFGHPDHQSNVPPFGANGDLVLDEEGIRWTPGWFARWRRRPAVRLPWRDIDGAEIIPAFGNGAASSLFTVRTAGREFRFLISDLDARQAGELLAEFLETRS